MNYNKCQVCKGKRKGCAVCMETGIAPNTLDLKVGGPFFFLDIASPHEAMTVHAFQLMEHAVVVPVTVPGRSTVLEKTRPSTQYYTYNVSDH